jgi:hypothetical protein
MKNAYDAWNVANLGDPNYNRLAPYTGKQSPGVYKCPGDRTTVRINNFVFPRIRSYSMNAAVGTIMNTIIGGGPSEDPNGSPLWGPWLDGSGSHVVNHPWRTYSKITDTQAPGPSMVFVFADEDEDSISLGCFNVSMQTPTTMLNWPGSYHGGTGCFSMLDGHAELHKWIDPRTRNAGHVGPNPSTGRPSQTQQPNNPDIVWIQAHTSARVQ